MTCGDGCVGLSLSSCIIIMSSLCNWSLNKIQMISCYLSRQSEDSFFAALLNICIFQWCAHVGIFCSNPHKIWEDRLSLHYRPSPPLSTQFPITNPPRPSTTQYVWPSFPPKHTPPGNCLLFCLHYELVTIARTIDMTSLNEIEGGRIWICQTGRLIVEEFNLIK